MTWIADGTGATTWISAITSSSSRASISSTWKASFEKLIVDAEVLQMMVEYLKPMEVDEQTLGLATIAEALADYVARRKHEISTMRAQCL